MARICRLLLLLSLAILLFGPSASFANRAWIPPRPEEPIGGVVVAKSPSRSVRMESENVTIRLAQFDYTVDAIFSLVNTGATETVSVGFPRRGASRPERHTRLFGKFDAWVDGQTAAFEEESGFFFSAKRFLSRFFTPPPENDGLWLVCQIPFPAGKRKTINALYRAAYNYSNGQKSAHYAVGTGSSWKDNIGKAMLTVDGTQVGGTNNFRAILSESLTPKLTTENAVVFEIDNWKPKSHQKLDILLKTKEPEKRLELYGRPEPDSSK